MEDKRPAPYPLRMTDDLRQKLTDHAKENGRSLNAEIVARLELTLNTGQGLLGQAMIESEIQKMEDRFEEMRKDLLDEVKQMLKQQKE